MKIFVCGLCINILFLVISDAVPVKIVPGDRKVVKKDGTTHTISKYYLVPNDFNDSINGPAAKKIALRTEGENGRQDDLSEKGKKRKASQVNVRIKGKGRSHVSAVDAEARVSENTQPNIPNNSLRVLVEPITIRTDITVKLNETERPEGVSIETIPDVTDNTQDFNDITKKQENLILSLFGGEVNRKAKINVDNFWKLVKHHIATEPNQVQLLSKIEKLSTFFDIYRILRRKSKRMPIDPIIDDLLGVLKKYGSVKKTKSKTARNKTNPDLKNDNLSVKVNANSGRVNDNEPSNVLRSDLNSSKERLDDSGLQFADSGQSRNEALKNATPTKEAVVLVKSEPIIIENTSWESQPWAIGDHVKNDVPLIMNGVRTEPETNTEKDSSWNTAEWVKYEKPSSTNTPREELSVTEKTLIIKETSEKDLPKIARQWLTYDEPSSADYSIQLEPDTVLEKFEKPLIIPENTQNAGVWVKYDDPLKINDNTKYVPALKSRLQNGLPIVLEEINEKDLPWTIMDKALNADRNSIALRTENANENPVNGTPIIKKDPLNIEEIFSSGDGSIILEPDAVPEANHEKLLIPEEKTENDLPLSIADNTNNVPGVKLRLQPDIPNVFGEITETDLPWTLVDKSLNGDIHPKEPVILDSRLTEDNPILIGKMLETFMPLLTDKWVKNYVPLETGGSKPEQLMISSIIKDNKPSYIGEIKGNDKPWTTLNNPLSVKNVLKENPAIDSLNSKEISDKDVPWISDEWVQDAVPLRVNNIVDKDSLIGTPILSKTPSNNEEIFNKGVPWLTNEWLQNAVPLHFDKITNKNPVGSSINENNPLNIKEIADDVPWLADDVPPSIDGSKNEPPVTDSRIKQDWLRIIKEASENKTPWAMFDNPLSAYDQALGEPGIASKIKESEPLNVEQITTQGLKSLLKPLTIEELPWHIEDRKHKDLARLIDEEAMNVMPWTINKNKSRNPYQIHTYVINPNSKIAGMNSLQYGNGDFSNQNDLGLMSAINKYQKNYGSQPSQQQSTVGINPGYSQSVMTENQSFLPVGPGSRELDFMKNNPTMMQSNTILNEPSFQVSSANHNKIVSGQQANNGNLPMTEKNNPTKEKFLSNAQQNTYGSESNRLTGNKVSVESSVNIDVGNNQPAATQTASAHAEASISNMPSNGYEGQSNKESGKKLVMESNVNLNIGKQQPFAQEKTQNIQAGSRPQTTMQNAHSSNSQMNYNTLNGRPTVQQTSFNNGGLVPITVPLQYQYNQPNNQISNINYNYGASPNMNGVKPYGYINLQQQRPQLAATYQLFSINNLLKLNENLRIIQLDTLENNQRLAILNLRRIVNLLLSLANHFAQNGKGNNWYENVFYNVKKNYHPLQPYVYAVIRQRWLHELLMVLNTNNYNLQVLYNPKILSFLAAWKFPENIMGFLNTEKLIADHVDSGMSYPPGQITPINQVTNNVVDMSNAVTNAGANNVQIAEADANAVLAILQKYMRFNMYLQKKEENEAGANKMMVLKEIVLFLKQKGYGLTIIQDLIRKVHGEMNLAESHTCHTGYKPDVVHHLYNVIFPVLRRSAQ
ncbi:uncharacterized protein LOC124643135 [Helicoverpa zea]|uniref:uncharacterized protein LOC124643135 n=1 Tax=Helicoverpa zea TaxID=7113 RepID=UPI001F571294|nr:uncharacterized protein LOC124643135 [Helicoverpa zea]